MGKFVEDMSGEEKKLVGEAAEMYFGLAKGGLAGDDISKEDLDRLVALVTDSNFAHGTDLAVR